MKISTIKVSYGMVINTGNYENVKVEVGLEADVPPGMAPDEAYDKLQAWCLEKCRQAHRAAKSKPLPAGEY